MNSLLPSVHDRPLFTGTPYEWTVLLAPVAILITATMAAISQPKSLSMRLFRYHLLLVGLLAAFKAATFRTLSRIPEYVPRNYGLGVLEFAIAMKLIEVTFLQTAPRRRAAPASFEKSPKQPSTAATSASCHKTSDKPRGDLHLLREALGFIGDPRLICYDVGSPSGFFPPETRDIHNRLSFLTATFRSAVIHFLALDSIQTMIKCIPNSTIGTPQGGTIFLPHLSPIPRYLLSTTVSATTCFVLYCSMQFMHDSYTLVSVGLFGQDPAEHPPLFWKPWRSTSLRVFWSKRWHAFFRRNFLVLGGIPGKALGGNIGALLGCFFISGLLHDVTMWGMGRGRDAPRVIGFFLLHAVGLIAEEVWRATTGRSISGVRGWIWTKGFFCVTGNLITEAFMQRGMAGGVYVVSDEWSPTRWIVKYLNPS